MNISLISSLLGVAAFVFQVAAMNGTSAGGETLKVKVSVVPQGPNIYLGESVLLLCTVESNSFVWSYRWSREDPHPTQTLNLRHLVSGDSYSITAVTREDAGGYRCQVEQRESNTTLSRTATLSVSELPPPSSLTLRPSSRQFFRGENFTIQCPASQTNTSGWMLKRFSQGRRVRKRILHTDRCSPLGGAVSTEKSNTCEFTAAGTHSGLYWCEGAEGRSNAVNITVSYGIIIMKTPTSPVPEGDTVVLYCQYWTDNHSTTIFFKNGAEIFTYNSSSSDRVINMTIENVRQEDEGSYKCASRDRKMESPESWLSVRRGNFRSTGSWKWIVVSCVFVLLFLVPLTVWLVLHRRHKMFCTRSCWPFSKENLPTVELPATKQDVTEVQWDLSWMEMSNLLDKHLYPGT